MRSNPFSRFARFLRIEHLEKRQLLATIQWINDDPAENDFNDVFTVNAPLAQAVVRRAISDWEAVIESFNYDPSDNLNDTFQLTVFADAAAGLPFAESFVETNDGKPKSATVRMPAQIAGLDWYFDPTPEDDAEFTGLISKHAAVFVDIDPGSGANDFYRVVVHEIGHALGFIAEYDRLDQALLSSTILNLSGGAVAYFDAGKSHLSITNHPNSVMNGGVGEVPPPGNPDETRRLFVSDLEAQILEEIYGYTVNYPSTFNTAHVTLDSQTGTLLVQGLSTAANDDIELNLLGNDIEVLVGSTREFVSSAEVSKIVIAKNGGDYAISVDGGITQPWQEVDYVVSSNQDAVDNGPLNDEFVDLDENVPGNQVTLRAAVQNANALGGSIYVPRGKYDLDITGGGNAAQGDLDVSGNVTVIGSGAGATVINSFALMERTFDVEPTGSLHLERLTLTGGWSNDGAAVRVAANSTNAAPFALTLLESAIAYNANNTVGGALYVGENSQAEVVRSVITNDHAAAGGGGIYAAGSSSGKATVELEASIVAKNGSTLSGNPDLMSGGSGANQGEFISRGNNLIGTVGNANYSDPTATDYVSPTGTVDYVVTSLIDSFDHDDDAYALSLREAVDNANLDDGPNSGDTETIWLPAWNFVLTRERQGGAGTTDVEVEWGDLDITDSLAVLAAGNDVATVGWKPGVADAVFDLLGDFTGDGLVGSPDDGDVDGLDMFAWQRQNGSGEGDPQLNAFSADGDDDGDVDGADLAIWQAYYGNDLMLSNLEVILA